MRVTITAGILALAFLGCGGGDEPKWEIVEQNLPGALISVWGTSASDVWAVGGDANDGNGPEVRHFDGTSWTRLMTGQAGDLWWVFGFAGGPVYMGGAGGTILKYQNGMFTHMTTPGNGTVFGIWGASPADVWAVGGATGGASGAFAWRLSGEEWVAEPAFPAELEADDAMWKVYGRGPSDVWLVGTRGKTVHWDGAAMAITSTGFNESLFTVHADPGGFVAVGGFGSGILLEHDGTGWQNKSPAGAMGLIGVCVSQDDGYAVGQYGDIFRRSGDAWERDPLDFLLNEALHAVWIDPDGGVWAVGGQVQAFPLINGVLLRKGN